jgi:hypothetical protein
MDRGPLHREIAGDRRRWRRRRRRRIMDCKLKGRSRIGRPELKWIDGVFGDIKKVGVKNL